MRRLAAVLLLLLLPLAAAGQGAEEMLQDPRLQARAGALYDELRCVQCRSESIASSNSDWAADARAIVREKLRAGATDAEILDFFHDRYGDYVLMTPPLALRNLALWLAPVALLLGGGVLAAVYVRRRQPAPRPGQEASLSEAEEARLHELLARQPPD